MVDSILKEVAIDNINFLHHWKFKMLFYKNAFSIRFLFLVFKRKHCDLQTESSLPLSLKLIT